MRSWAVLMGNLVQEIIYVHSKTLIVDDRYVICGSANINDRSLIGKRDSELAAVMKDEEFISSRLNGKKCQVGKFAFSFRQKIFRLLLGCYFNNPDRIDVSDIVCDEFYNLFRSISAKNTAIYDEVFKCIPSDNILTFDDLKNYTSRNCLKKSDPVKVRKLSSHAVLSNFHFHSNFVIFCREKSKWTWFLALLLISRFSSCRKRRTSSRRFTRLKV